MKSWVLAFAAVGVVAAGCGTSGYTLNPDVVLDGTNGDGNMLPDVADASMDTRIDAIDHVDVAIDVPADVPMDVPPSDVVCGDATHVCSDLCVLSDSPATCGTSCDPCPTAPNGMASCDGASCGFMCNSGFHLCSLTCADNMAVGTCGSMCTPCAAPSNGTATCDGSACGIACNTGYHVCGSACVSDTDVSTCGTSCTPCAPPTNSSPTCDGHQCGFTCVTGYHACSGICVGSTSTASCGTSCTPCTVPMNATSTCSAAGVCGFTCNAGFADCDGNPTNGCEADLSLAATCGTCTTVCGAAAPDCVPSGGSFSCQTGCGSGQTLCGTSCATLATDPGHCGMCSMACAVPMNGSATCTAGTCGESCSAGFHLCGTACVSNSDPGSCGTTSCTACATPPNSTATCNGTSCGFTCVSGAHLCSGACVLNTDVASCGSSCGACPTSPDGSATCDGTSCGIACIGGYHLCGGTCLSNSSTSSCGASCAACSAPANSTPTCDGTSCGFTCNAGYHLCSGACVPNTAVTSCGASSCVACANPANASATCNGVACGESCNSGFADCDSMISDGCETDLSQPSNCGACGNVCPIADPVCQASGGTYVCATGCSGGQVRCGGTCTNTQTDPNNCGSCGSLCGLVPNGTPTCTAGACGFTCNSGYHLCGTGCVSNMSTNSCGTTACTACSPPANSTATCDGTSCGFSCNTGYNLCGGACVPSNDVVACGPSCTVCPQPANSVASCTAGVCSFACNSPWVQVGAHCDLTPPVPTYPMSSSVTSNTQQTMSFYLAGTTPAAAVDICHDPACASIASTTVLPAGVTSFSPPVGAISRGVWFWRLRGATTTGSTGTLPSPVWELWSMASTTHGASGGVWGSIPDVNRDGYADVLVGTPSFVTGPTVSVMLGQGGPVPTIVLQRNITGGNGTVASAGDVNGDGYSDVIVGGSTVSIFLGGPTGIASTAYWTTSGTGMFGANVAGIGDVNGDGYGDVAVANIGTNIIYFYYGTGTTMAYQFNEGEAGIGANPLQLGWTMAAGDFDGNGYSDLLVGSNQQGGGSSPGGVWLFHGTSSGLSMSVAPIANPLGSASTSGFGFSVAALGDQNNDGYPDAIVGSLSAQHAYVYNGGSAGLSLSPNATLAYSSGTPNFGNAVTGVDYNSDGFSDAVVTDWGAPTTGGEVYVYFSPGSGGLTNSTPVSFGITPLSAIGSGSHFGQAISMSGNTSGCNTCFGLIIGGPNIGEIELSFATEAAVAVGAPSGAAGAFGWILASLTPFDPQRHAYPFAPWLPTRTRVWTVVN